MADNKSSNKKNKYYKKNDNRQDRENDGTRDAMSLRDDRQSRGGRPSKDGRPSRNDKPVRDGRYASQKSVPAKPSDIKAQAGSVSRCSVSSKCGACTLIDVPYEEQLVDKTERMHDMIGNFGKVNDIIGMEHPEHYRNKVHAVFSYDRRTKMHIAGTYQEGTHKVVAVNGCLLDNKRSDRIISAVRQIATDLRINIYDEDTGDGLLRHILIRTGHETGEIMVVIVLASPIFQMKNKFVMALRSKFPEITTIVQNVNTRQTSMVLGPRNITLYGKGFIEDKLCGLTYRISPNSFYQINSVQTEKLYAKAMEYAHLTGNETVLDAYCGIGTVGMTAAAHAGNVISVELNPDAVRDAEKNARRNKIENIIFYENDAGVFMKQVAESGDHVDVVFMDPPRTGASEEFLESLVTLSPDRVVYISCGPDTLARDLDYLTEHGYEMKEATPVDMFPFTVHVETVVLMSRVENQP